MVVGVNKENIQPDIPEEPQISIQPELVEPIKEEITEIKPELELEQTDTAQQILPLVNAVEQSANEEEKDISVIKEEFQGASNIMEQILEPIIDEKTPVISEPTEKNVEQTEQQIEQSANEEEKNISVIKDELQGASNITEQILEPIIDEKTPVISEPVEKNVKQTEQQIKPILEEIINNIDIVQEVVLEKPATNADQEFINNENDEVSLLETNSLESIQESSITMDNIYKEIETQPIDQEIQEIVEEKQDDKILNKNDSISTEEEYRNTKFYQILQNKFSAMTNDEILSEISAEPEVSLVP